MSIKRKKVVKIVCISLVVLLGGVVFLEWYLLDGLSGNVLRVMAAEWLEDPDSTVYASGYSDKNFRKIHAGMTYQDVLALLGKPIVETWYYPQQASDNTVFAFTEEKLVFVRLVVEGQWYFLQDACLQHLYPTLQKGQTTMDEVYNLFGNAPLKRWAYTHSPGSGSYRVRQVILEGGHVKARTSWYYVD